MTEKYSKYYEKKNWCQYNTYWDKVRATFNKKKWEKKKNHDNFSIYSNTIWFVTHFECNISEVVWEVTTEWERE